MALNQNQFTQSVIQGQPDLKFSNQSISGQIDSTSNGDLVAGQSVKMVDSAGGIPKFVECAADSDDVFGFINYDYKKATFGVADKVEVSCMRGNVMYMTASAAIARNAKVSVVIASKKIVTSTGAMKVIGRTLDKASADGSLVRVLIDLPGDTLAGIAARAATVAATAAAAAATVGGASPTAAQVDTGIATAIAPLVVSINAILTSLKNAGLMA